MEKSLKQTIRDAHHEGVWSSTSKFCGVRVVVGYEVRREGLDKAERVIDVEVIWDEGDSGLSGTALGGKRQENRMLEHLR